MARQFDIPVFYRSRIITRVRRGRQVLDPRKRDLSPAELDFGPVRVLLARHFGFCFGVENAIEIAYETIETHPGKRIFLLSEMIHNPNVNRDLEERGVRFMFTPAGEPLVPWEDLTSDDIVIVPAFGTTVEIQAALSARGIDPYTFNTTCPFVEKVWKRSQHLGDEGYTVVVHGKSKHEETRATFSHSERSAPTVVVRDIEETRILADIIRGATTMEAFESNLREKCSEGFDPARHLSRIGVVNQTTMLAVETREIAQEIRQALLDRYGAEAISEHFADTSDTLCYATNENQNATLALADHGADLALVVGGYNSSNTSHIVDMLKPGMPTYFVRDAAELISCDEIQHFDLDAQVLVQTRGWLPANRPLDVALTCGASCPDAVVEGVLERLLSFHEDVRPAESVVAAYPDVPDLTDHHA